MLYNYYMRLLTIVICKLLRKIGKFFNRGSSMPGQIALKIYPNILKKIKLPKYVIAVSGSNGKTSTVEMIKEVLEASGLKVAYNFEGSNQTEGITTLVLNDCNLAGVCQSDVLLMESDERYAKITFKSIIPTHYVITNLYRDQLTRNGNPEWIFKYLKESIHHKTCLLLNGDDPLVSLLGADRNAYYFGINDFSNDGEIGVYDDGVYCPKCKGKLVYKKRHFGNIGDYKCRNCGYKRPELIDAITKIDINSGHLIINDKNKIKLALKSSYNAYNILATFSLCEMLGIEEKTIIKTLNNYVLKNGRVTEFKLNNRKGTLLTSKHENSVSYNQSMKVIASANKKVNVLILVDAISRKYFTSETSWLWDVDFNILNSDNVSNIVLSGQYASDLAERFLYTNINQNIIHIEKDIAKAIEYTGNIGKGHIYVVTCFSDMQKVLSRVEVI